MAGLQERHTLRMGVAEHLGRVFPWAVQEGIMPEMDVTFYQAFKATDGGTQYTQWMEIAFYLNSGLWGGFWGD